MPHGTGESRRPAPLRLSGASVAFSLGLAGWVVIIVRIVSAVPGSRPRPIFRFPEGGGVMYRTVGGVLALLVLALPALKADDVTDHGPECGR